ncbi:MAG: isoprenylcysteine carboxylmethyltransferase family protein [Bacteroidota bacterium]
MTLFIIIWSLWFISEILLNRLFRSSSYGKNNHDKGSIKIIWIVTGLANSAGIISAIIFKFPVSDSFIIPYSGLSLILSGMIFRFVSIMTLGKFFTVDVSIQKDHQLKKDGVYRFIRHPSYLGSILSFIGFGLSLNNWISLFMITIPVTTAMIYRIKVEEKLLIEQFGSTYTDYMKRTHKLIPRLY